MAYQYSCPPKPRGENVASWVILTWSPSCWIRNSSQAFPGKIISAYNFNCFSFSTISTRQKSTLSPTLKCFGSRRPRRKPTPPTKRSITPLAHHKKSEPYQPVSPPICSIERQTQSIGASVTTSRLSFKIISPAQSGSLCAFCQGAVGAVASDQRVSTWLLEVRVKARLIAVVTSINPSAGFGTIASILFFGSATVSFIKEPTSGLASAVGTGVTKPIQRLESFGVRTGTLIIQRRRNPEQAANFCIISA